MSERSLRDEALLWLALYRDLGVTEITPRRRPVPEPAARPEPAASPSASPPTEPAPASPPPVPAVSESIPSALIEELVALEDRSEALARLEAEVLGDCRRCRLAGARRQIVFGVGNPYARLMFVGEGPGAEEDRQGEPFVGKAGQLLDRIIAAMGLKREQVYIGNVVKCRPPDNRTPLPDEMATCLPFVEAQIRVIRPELIVALGRTALEGLIGRTVGGIIRVRGQWFEHRGIPVKATFHPAYLLRNVEAKRPVWEDMQDVMARLEIAPPPRNSTGGV